MDLTVSRLSTTHGTHNQDNLIDLRCLHTSVIELFLSRVDSVLNERGSKGLKLGAHKLLIDVLRSTETR